MMLPPSTRLFKPWSILAFALVVAPLTLGAIGAWPIFDDAWSWLYLKEQGTDFYTSIPDRPLMGFLWKVLASSEQSFWLASFIAHAVLWGSLGILTGMLWRRLFPNLEEYSWLVACLAVAPFGYNVQIVATNIVLGSLLSVVLAYSAFLLLLRFVKSGDRLGHVALAASLPLLAVSILFMEYALSVVATMIVITIFYPWLVSNPESRPRANRAVILAAATAAVAYGLYFFIAELTAQPDVMYAHPPARGKVEPRILLKLVQAIWQGLAGNLVASFSDVQFTSKIGLLGAAFGALVGASLCFGSRFQVAVPREGHILLYILILLGAFVSGLAPVLLTGRTPWDLEDGTTARFGIPVLPIIAMLLVLSFLSFTRQQVQILAVLALGFIAGHASFWESWSAVQERNEMAALGDALLPHVSASGGYTAAVVPLVARRLGPRRQWELTARLAANWPHDVRKKFWAFRYGGDPPLQMYVEEASRLFGARSACKRPNEIAQQVRFIKRQGKLDRLLWVERLPNGTISIADYCVDARRV